MNQPTVSHFLGLRTVLYHAPDLDKAKAWYSSVLGIAPYFDQPFYVGFNYWGVSDAGAALGRLLSLGATQRTSVQEVGDGIKVATVCDPFGNILGVIENPHFELPRQ